jgi:uncharacterized protein (DUF433 family)
MLLADPVPVPLQTDEDGAVRVGGTRVTLDTVVAAFQDGATAEEIAEQFPAVALPDVYAVIAYYLRHRQEVESYVEQGRRQGDSSRRAHETKLDRQEVRNRLLARRHSSP